MEHPCHQCGAAVEDGVPFCPQCNAPQIRVDGASATPPLPPGTPGQLQPPAQPVPLTPQGAPPPPGRIEWHHAFPATVTAGLLLAVSFALPWASFCLWGFAGGALAVALYQRRRPGPVSPGMGARLGAITGFFGFVAFAIIISVELLATHGARVREIWVQMLQQAASRNPSPAVQEMIQRLSTPEGMAVLFTVSMVVVLAFFLVFSSLGGVVGSSLFGRREQK